MKRKRFTDEQIAFEGSHGKEAMDRKPWTGTFIRAEAMGSDEVPVHGLP
jgi:hypothetical protein